MSAVRSEKYVIRPFVDLDAAEELFHNVRLCLDAQEHEAGPVVLDQHTLSSADLVLRLPSPAEIVEAVERTPVAPIDCGLVVVAASNSNRRSCVVFRDYARYLTFGQELEIDREIDPLVFKDRGGFVITVALVLLHELQSEPLRPHLVGTWLARREFRLIPERAEFSFSPEPLTGDIRRQFGLPDRAPSYVRIDEDHLLTADELSSAVSVYLDDDILRLLQQSQNDALSIHIQSELAVTTMGAVARAAVGAVSREVDGPAAPTDVADYPAVEHFLTRLAKRLERETLSSLLSLIDDPDALEAHLRAAFDIRRFTLAALKSTPTHSVQEAGSE